MELPFPTIKVYIFITMTSCLIIGCITEVIDTYG